MLCVCSTSEPFSKRICIPKQIPKSGTLFSLAYLIVAIFPSIPLFPNPPGTTIPLYSDSFSFAFSEFIFSQLIRLILTFTLFSYVWGDLCLSIEM